jgi:pantothenate kinase
VDIDALDQRARGLMAATGRSVLGICGAPGAGKSTLAALLASRIGAAAVVVPMDGFHLHDDELALLGLAERKGAPETFDVAGYAALLARVRDDSGHTVHAPEFDRSRELCVAGAIAVRPEHRLVITEGNYLLNRAPGWFHLRALLDEVWFVESNESARVERLVARHVAHGKAPDLARRWTMSSDQANADLVSLTRDDADLVVLLE